MDPGPKPNVALVASRSARNNEHGAFLRFVRDHSAVLKQVSLHCTLGTALSLTSTGLYSDHDVVRHRPGSLGGLVELSAMVARDECVAVLLIIDPHDMNRDEGHVRVLKRIADQHHVRLVTTLADAIRWVRFEALRSEDQSLATYDGGASNLIRLRCLGLSAHDKGKADLVDFVTVNSDILAQHREILATGGTGWLLKLLYADEEQEPVFLSKLAVQRSEARIRESIAAVHPDDLPNEYDIHDILPKLRSRSGVSPDARLAGAILPLAPGLEGGHVLLAEAVLQGRCDTIVCFHDPGAMGPHSPDSQMLERTCRLPGISVSYLTNVSAYSWAQGVRREFGAKSAPLITDQLRNRYDLDEAVVVDRADDEDSLELGLALCRAAAGYVHAAVSRLMTSGGGTIAVTWGWAMRAVVDALSTMQDQGLLEKPALGRDRLLWLASLGNLHLNPELNAGQIADDLARFFGGSAERLAENAFVPEGHRLSAGDEKVVEQLERADLVLMSAAPWNETSGLYVRSGWRPGHVYPNFAEACGTIGGIFLKADGSPVESQWRMVGLDYERLATAAAKGNVVLICGGHHRRDILRAALRRKLVSVLITSSETAQWLLTEQADWESNTYGRVLLDVQSVKNGSVHALVRSWDPERKVVFPISQLPFGLQAALISRELPTFLLAVVNLGAETSDDLDLHGFELAPELGPEDELPAPGPKVD